MEVKCIPRRQVFANSTDEYRVLSCDPDGISNIELNKYGNFTLSGTNLGSLKINQPATIEVEKDVKSRFPASYILTGYVGIKADGEAIKVAPEYELEILERFMSSGQAKSVNKAYPDFVFKVLNGLEEEIDSAKIFNVGDKRLSEYVKKIKDDCKNILLYPEAYCAGITTPNEMRLLRAFYTSPEQLKEALEENPYHVYIDVVGFSFEKADRLVLEKRPEFATDPIRCKYACLDVLRQNEREGDSKLNANTLASVVTDMIPEDKESIKHIVATVKNSPEIYYDKETKYASLSATYRGEQIIAKTILERVKHPRITPMDWEKYTSIDGFALTDEQSNILKAIQTESIAFLTAPAGGGKSSAMKCVIRMLEGSGFSYSMLCPTGTAAKVLSKATGREAMTIHMFLARQLQCGEFLILEESSMLDIELLSRLFDTLDEEVKIIFICDPSQLPSIGCGNIVHDILNAHIVNNTQLTKIFRYQTSGLITVATDIRNGNPESFKNNYDDYHYMEAEEDSVNQVARVYADMLSRGYKKNDILILTPYNKTDKGTYAINDVIQERFNSNDYLPVDYSKDRHTIRFKIGDRVVNKKNNYHVPIVDEDGGEDGEMFVANGTIGVIRHHWKDEDGLDCFAIEFEDGIGKFRGADIGNLLLGYATTIHAAQGGQASAVILLIDKVHRKMVNRNILYVGATRSKDELCLIGDADTIENGMEIEATNLRETWLGDMLKEEE